MEVRAQINNLLRLSHASKVGLSHEIETQDCLSQIGAFLFHYDQALGGSVISP